MVIELGFVFLVLSALSAGLSTIAALFGGLRKQPRWIRYARKSILLTLPLLTVSIGILTYLLLNERFEVFFVYSVSNISMPAFTKLTALWGGQAGSLLFWNWLLALCIAIFAFKTPKSKATGMPWAILTCSGTLSFFLILSLAFENPFARFWELSDSSLTVAMFPPTGAVSFTPPDGRSLNPLLRHIGMAIHPPMLYIGYALTLIPFALTIEFLANGQKEKFWLRHIRPYIFISWAFLSLGLALGSWWSYEVLGWGGYWGWDPVETVALLPWLSGVVLIHNLFLHEKRRVFRRLTFVFAILTWLLSLFGSFLTRSGIMTSVHAFSNSTIGLPMGIFLVISATAGIVLLALRWRNYQSELKAGHWLSLETITFLSNILFMGVLLVCLWGLLYPLFSTQLSSRQISLGASYYRRALTPIFTFILLLMGLAPLTSWGKPKILTIQQRSLIPLALALVSITGFRFAGSIENPIALIGLWLAIFTGGGLLQQILPTPTAPIKFNPHHSHTRSKWGGRLIHLGAALIALGIIGMEYLVEETQVTLLPDQTLTQPPYTLTFTNLKIQDKSEEVLSVEAVIELSEDDQPVDTFRPRRDIYLLREQYVTIPAIRRTLGRDLYLLLLDYQISPTEQAALQVSIYPLVNWLWIGSGILVAGAFIAGWPQKTSQSKENRQRSSK